MGHAPHPLSNGRRLCYTVGRMTNNLRTVLITAALFGLSTGAYEFALPLLLDAWGVSLSRIGLIFALAALVMVLARILPPGGRRWPCRRC